MDAATIEETNRIRVSLGMKPLPVPGGQQSQQAASPTLTSGRDDDGDGEAASTLESRHAEAHNNYKKHMEAEVAKKKREEKAAAVRRARELAQRKSLLEGTGLGEENGAADLGAKAWLMGQKKRQKKIEKARKLEEELAAAEAAAAAAVHYTSKDLAGIKIAHDKADLAEGDAHILTLKDATIDENEAEGDELEDLGLRENEQLADRLQLKKKRPGYNPHEDEDGQPGLLSQYDEEIYGKKSKQFTLDAGGLVAELSDILEQPARKAADLQGARFDDTIGMWPSPCSASSFFFWLFEGSFSLNEKNSILALGIMALTSSSCSRRDRDLGRLSGAVGIQSQETKKEEVNQAGEAEAVRRRRCISPGTNRSRQ